MQADPGRRRQLSGAYAREDRLRAGARDWGKPANNTVIYSPDAFSWRPQRVDVVVVGQDVSTGVRHVFRRYYDNGTYSGWQDLGAPPGITLASRATAVAWNVDHFDVFVLSSESPPRVWHGYSSNGIDLQGWSSWGYPPTQAALSVDAASWGDGRIDLFVLALDGSVWHMVYDHGIYSGWGNWGNPGYSLFRGVGAVGRGEGFVDVASGYYPDLVHRYWQDGYSGWIEESSAYQYTRPDMDSW